MKHSSFSTCFYPLSDHLQEENFVKRWTYAWVDKYKIVVNKMEIKVHSSSKLAWILIVTKFPCHIITVMCTDAMKSYIFDLHRALHRNTCIISIVKPTRCTNVYNLFSFGMTLYIFWTVFPSIISRSRLSIQQLACCCMDSLEFLMTDGKTVRNYVECHSKIK